VQVFENKGAMMGCSNPHPHSQVWATSHIPNEPVKEVANQKAYFNEHGHPLLSNYLDEEHKRKESLDCHKRSFHCVVPFWAIWPFEALVIAHSRRATPYKI